MRKDASLASEIELQISQGLIQPGEKIGSVREISRLKGVGVNTVIRAYEILEDRGLVISRPQSGFYALGPRPGSSLTPPRQRVHLPRSIGIPNLVSLVFEFARDRETIPFGAACLTPDLYPSESINKLTRMIFREQPNLLGRYEWPPGSFEYRRQISRRLEKTGCLVDPGDVVATNGATDALALALRATCSEGDTVLIESPQYFGILQALHHLRLKVIEVPTHPVEGVDLKQIECSLRRFRISAGVFIPNFSNPMGMLMSDEKKVALVEIFSRHNVPIIEDHVYADLSFRGIQPKALKAFDKTGKVLTCSSFSKTISPGLRIGWLAPGRYGKRVRALQLSTTTSGNSLSQQVIATYLASREHEKNLKTLQLHCLHQTERFSEAILSQFPKNTRVSAPSGGFVLWVELPKKVDSVELFRKALASGISIAPGTMFSASGNYRNYIRLSCGTHWTPEVEQALVRLGEHVGTLCAKRCGS